MTAGKPGSPAADAFYEKDVHRKQQLEGHAAGKSGEALTPAEVDELLELRGRWTRYCAYRGRVDSFLADQRKDADRRPSAADPTHGVATAMRERRQGYRHAAADREANTTEATSAAHGHSDPLPSAGRRAPGTGVDRLAKAVAANADRLEANRLKPIGFVW